MAGKGTYITIGIAVTGIAVAAILILYLEGAFGSTSTSTSTSSGNYVCYYSDGMPYVSNSSCPAKELTDPNAISTSTSTSTSTTTSQTYITCQYTDGVFYSWAGTPCPSPPLQDPNNIGGTTTTTSTSYVCYYTDGVQWISDVVCPSPELTDPNQATATSTSTSTVTSSISCSAQPGNVLFNGQNYPYVYEGPIPQGFSQIQVPKTMFVQYNGGSVANFCAHGCGNVQCYGALTINTLYTDGKGDYWFQASGKSYQFSGGFST